VRFPRSAILLSLATTGCYEPPNYRYQVTSSGQGNVQVSTVPKDPTAEQPTPTAAVSAQVEQQQRIDALEAQVRALSAENAQLKHQPTTAPTTRPE
jgi:hypothetical protein